MERSDQLPLLVIVTGEPGSGKTTLGRQVAAALRVPFLSRDDTRGGLLATAGMWTGQMRATPEREAARTTFLRLVESVLGEGITLVIEFIPLRDRPEEMSRLQVLADCIVVLVECGDARARAEVRDRADPLLNRKPVLTALGYSSIEDYLAHPMREFMRTEMNTDLGLPVLRVQTDDGYAPPLHEIAEWVIAAADAVRDEK